MTIQHLNSEPSVSISDSTPARKWLVAGLLAGALACPYLTPAATTDDFPWRRDVPWAAVWIGQIHGAPGHVGFEVLLSEGYNPGHNAADPYYAAMAFSKDAPISYYKYFEFGPGWNTFPFGMFIDNQNQNACEGQPYCRDTPVLRHDWARRVERAVLEIYSHDSQAGGLRLEVANFSAYINGGVYSSFIGDIHLPRVGEPDVGWLNGFFWRNGRALGDHEATLDVFQQDVMRRSTTGYPLYGFASTHSNADGYYHTGPVPTGLYQAYVWAQGNRKRIVYLNIAGPHGRIDMDASKGCYGFGECRDAETGEIARD